MGMMTESSRQRLQEFRRQNTQKKVWLFRRKLLLILALVGAAASFYVFAQDAERSSPLPMISSLWL